jgi:hypothetical protein
MGIKGIREPPRKRASIIQEKKLIGRVLLSLMLFLFDGPPLSSSHATGGQTRSGWNHVFIRSALISSTTYATPSVNLIHSYMYEWIFSSSLNASEDYRKIATQEAAS